MSSRKKSQLIHTSTGERGLKIMYSRKKNSIWFIHQLVNEDSRLCTHAKNSRRFIHQLANEDSRLCPSPQKIPVDSYINWRTRIQDYVLTQKKIPVDSYIKLGERGFKITFSRKKSQLNHTSTSERGLKIMYSRKKIPVNSYINWRMRIQDYVLTQKIPVD